jgi:hypothetical protein
MQNIANHRVHIGSITHFSGSKNFLYSFLENVKKQNPITPFVIIDIRI